MILEQHISRCSLTEEHPTSKILQLRLRFAIWLRAKFCWMV